MDRCNQSRLDHALEMTDRCRHLIIGVREYATEVCDGWEGHAYVVLESLINDALRALDYERGIVRDVIADEAAAPDAS